MINGVQLRLERRKWGAWGHESPKGGWKAGRITYGMAARPSIALCHSYGRSPFTDK